MKGEGYFKKSMFIGLFIFQVEMIFQFPWKSKKHNLDKMIDGIVDRDATANKRMAKLIKGAFPIVFKNKIQ